MILDSSDAVSSPHVTVRRKIEKRPAQSNGSKVGQVVHVDSACCSRSGANSLVRSLKTVRFGETVTVREIPCLNDYSKAQLLEMYHTRKEYKAIRNQLLRELKMLQNADRTMDDDSSMEEVMCERGLECELKPFRIERRQRQDLGRLVVFEGQALYQRRRKRINSEHLAYVYAVTTKDAREHAVSRAISGHEEIQGYLLCQ